MAGGQGVLAVSTRAAIVVAGSHTSVMTIDRASVHVVVHVVHVLLCLASGWRVAAHGSLRASITSIIRFRSPLSLERHFGGAD